MAITLLGLPANWRAPGTYISNVPRNGGATVGLQPTMIMGQMSSTGTATANIPVQVFSYADAKTLFGVESMLTAMFAAYRQSDPTGSVWCVPLTDGAGTAASVTVTVTGTATAAGAINLYVANTPVQCAVAVGDAATAVGTAILAAINAKIADPNMTLNVTASAAGGVVTLTAGNKGILASDVLQVSVNKNGTANGEFTPAGLTVAVGTVTAGTVDPSIDTAVTNITPLPWSFLVCPYTDTTNAGKINTLLSDTTGRWSPVQQTYGVAFAAVKGTLAQTTTWGASVSANKHMTALGILDSQTPTFVAAAIYAGLAANTSRSNPALPIVGPLPGLDAPSVINRLRRVDENTLLFSGVSPIRVDGSGNPRLSRAVQLYQSDTNYLNVETDLLVQYVDTYLRSDLENKFAQVALLADGNPVAAGSQATTPSLVLAHCWGIYLDLEQMGLVQNSKQFINASYAEADLGAGVVSLYLPVMTAGQLRIIRILNSFS